MSENLVLAAAPAGPGWSAQRGGAGLLLVLAAALGGGALGR
jgi:hypothetical protein